MSVTTESTPYTSSTCHQCQKCHLPMIRMMSLASFFPIRNAIITIYTARKGGYIKRDFSAPIYKMIMAHIIYQIIYIA